MRKLLLFILSTFIYISCTTVKNTQKQLNSGNYDSVISNSLEKLRNNKTRKKSQSYIVLLEDAFAKAVNRDIKSIDFLEKENNPANYVRIYESYLKLNTRQELIKPLLPLYKSNTSNNAVFAFENYDPQIIEYKNKVTEYVYTTAVSDIKKAQNKLEYRRIYDDLIYLNNITPNYKNTASLIEEAHYKGINFVMLGIKNSSRKIIPRRLQDELLNINTYGLNNLWTVYHSTSEPNMTYDYQVTLHIRSINISPEKTTERQLQKEKLIVDGWEYLKDEEGKIVKDENGENIKVDAFTKVTCEYYEFSQFKKVTMGSRVLVKNLRTNQNVDSFPLSSQFVFDHIYANYDGDKRALNDDLLTFLQARAISYPSNEQMVYDAGQDLKNQLKSILTRQQF